MPSEFARLKFKINPRSVENAAIEWNADITRRGASIMRRLVPVFRRHMRNAVQRSFPGSTTIPRSIFSRYNESSRQVQFGFEPAGISDQTTGRPLREYLPPLIDNSRVTPAAPGRSPVRTRQPALMSKTRVNADGDPLPGWLVINRLTPWAQARLGLGPAAAKRVATAIAEQFESTGMPRQPLMTQLILPRAIGQSNVELSEDLTNKWGLALEVQAIIMQETQKKTRGTRRQAAGARAADRGKARYDRWVRRDHREIQKLLRDLDMSILASQSAKRANKIFEDLQVTALWAGIYSINTPDTMKLRRDIAKIKQELDVEAKQIQAKRNSFWDKYERDTNAMLNRD